MWPEDNIFRIYCNIGKRVPFLVKRCEIGLERSSSEERRLDPNKDRTFLVEKVIPKGKYGSAYGKCFVDGQPDDSYRKNFYPDINDDEIPCAGCSEWVLLDVPGVDIDTYYPKRSPDFKFNFGKYKGKTLREIYKEDPRYIFWLMEDDCFRVDFNALLNIPQELQDNESIIEAEMCRIFPKATVDSAIPFGKHAGKTYREIFEVDPSYLDWFIQNNYSVELDYKSFSQMLHAQTCPQIVNDECSCGRKGMRGCIFSDSRKQ